MSIPDDARADGQTRVPRLPALVFIKFLLAVAAIVVLCLVADIVFRIVVFVIWGWPFFMRLL